MMWWQWHNFPRGGHTQANRFDALASESEEESSWESFEDLDNVEGDPSIYESGAEELLHLIDSVDTDSQGDSVTDELEEGELGWLIQCYGKSFSYYDVGLRDELFLSEEDLETTLGDEESLSGIPIDYETVSSLSMCFGAADASGDKHADQQDVDSIIADFLSFPRGGAGGGGAASSSRKREQINKLVGVIQEWGKSLDDGDDDDACLKRQVGQLSDTLKGWVTNLPSKQKIRDTLESLVRQLDDSEDPIEQFAPRKLHGAVQPQSFYKSFGELQRKDKGGPSAAQSTGNKKGKGKGKSKTEELPKFDLKRAFPDRDLFTWQRLVNILEKGEPPKVKSRTICLCQSVGQILEFQEMAKAWGDQYLKTDELRFFLP